MKSKLWIGYILALLAVAALAAPPTLRNTAPKGSAGLDSDTWIDANRIFMFVTNDGSFAQDLGGLLGKTDGLYYPYTSLRDIQTGKNNNTVVYASGVWFGATDSATGEVLISVSEYSEENVPGPMVDSTFSPDAPEFKVYKLFSDSVGDNANADYTNWPVEQGAPVDSLGLPALTGDQMLWSVYNDADPNGHTNNAGSTNPLGIEIQQTTIAFARQGALGDIVFVKFKIKNRGPKTLQDMYVSLWADPDLGDASDDLVGCDTMLSLGFCYNGDEVDGQYGSRPPAVGYDFFQGPLVAGTEADTGFMWGQLWPGFRNLPMSSFNKYINGTDPQNFTHTYNYMQGLNPDGTPLANGTKFAHPGDPVAGTGELDENPADRRFMLSTGPFIFRPGDSTEIVGGIMVQQGANRLQSITLLKQLDEIAQQTYDSNFVVVKPPAPPKVSVTEKSGEIILAWTDTSEVDPGDAPFEGYTVLQGPTSSGPWTVLPLQTYDVQNGITMIFDSLFDLESSNFLPRAVKFGTDAGIKRYFSTTQDFLTGEPLHNLTQYFFRVEAYSYDPTLRKGDITPTSAVVLTVTPSANAANIDQTYAGLDVITVDLTGGTTATVEPIVVDPVALNDHQYEITFDTIPSTDSTSAVTFWRLRDVTLDTVLYDTMLNFSGDDDYPIVSGMLLKVTGAPIGLKAGDAGWAISSGTRRFTWAGGDFGMETFNGAAGYAGTDATFWTWPDFTLVSPLDLVDIEIRLATTDANGVFDTTQENVSKGYRYLRGAGADPARPEFIPFILNTGSGYRFQEWKRNMPLSVWDISSDPPRRLVVGFLENNTFNGLVDGIYWPPFTGSTDYGDNVAGDGPREWLFIFNQDYSEDTPDPLLQNDVLNDVLPLMYHMTWLRRQEAGWSVDELDAIQLYKNVPIQPSDTFSFTATAQTRTTAGGAARLDQIRAIPNPYYLFSSYDQSTNSREIRFSNLPEQCTISIYTITGDLVAKVEKNSVDSWTSWDVETSNGIPVASGIYVWVVDAPGIGQKIGKLAVFTEVEQLPQY